jgi:hypothetical protein
MAFFTHQCNKCLKKTNENGVQIMDDNYVSPISACLNLEGGSHTWIAWNPPLSSYFTSFYKLTPLNFL